MLRAPLRLLSLLLLASSCRIVPEAQLPATQGPFEVRRLSPTYALSVDPTGRPLGIWDLGYPVVRREGDPERERFPVRLVNFVDPGESADRRGAERRRFGVRSFFAGLATLNVAKWYQTTDLFEVREVRSARTAMLYTWLGSTDVEELRGHGLTRESVESAREQLDLGGSGVREDAVAPSAVKGDESLEIRRAAERFPALADDASFRTVTGEDWTLVLSGSEPVAFYDAATDIELWLPERDRDEPVSDGVSLGASTAGAVALIVGGIAIEVPIGIPFSVFTSIVPFAPFRKEDPDFGARGRLLALLSRADADLPVEIEPHRARLLEALRADLQRENPYWPATPNEHVGANWSWLVEQSRVPRL